MPVEVVEEVQRLYQERNHDFNVKHFHEKLVEEQWLTVSYAWTKNLLQESGLVSKDRPRKKHRNKREKPARGDDSSNRHVESLLVRERYPLRPDRDIGRCDKRYLLRPSSSGRTDCDGDGWAPANC